MVDVVIFEGNQTSSEVEEMMLKVRHAALADNVHKLLSVPEVERVFLITNQPQLSSITDNPRFITKVNTIRPAEFHFGRQLIDLVERERLQTVFYLGGAAVPLISCEELSVVCRKAAEKQRRYVTNNVQSADIIAFSPAAILSEHTLPVTDNALVMMLRFDARFEQVLLPVTLGTQFDIDTPSDLLVLAASPFGGPNLRAALTELCFDTKPIERLKDALKGEYPELALIGRIGAPAISLINHHFKVRLRIFSEERGMKALGRLERGEVISLLGFWLEEIGPERFFAYLAQTVQAALIDTRVLFAHQGRVLSDADRFWSDLGRFDKIDDPWVREFTRAASECGIPVLLGGHSLVAGCVWAFVEEIGCLF